MNKVFLSGNLTRDPEIRYSQSGVAFARMGIAVNRPYSKEKATDFFNMTAFNKTAEFCQRYMTKGTRVLVEGRLQTSSYENKDGVKVNSVDIMVENIEFAGARRTEDSGGNYSKPSEGGGYSARPDDGYSERRASVAPPKKEPDAWSGEPIDPEDTPF